MPYVRILGFVTLLLRLMAAAGPVLAATPMPADQAFQLRAQLDEEEGIELTWTIAPGYYLYRDKIVVTLDGQRVRIATEKGQPKDDPNFGMTEVYHASTTATVPAELLPEKGRIIVTYQGCGENTICYPPIAKTVDLATLLIAEAPEDNEAVHVRARKRQQRSRTFRHGVRPRPMERRRAGHARRQPVDYSSGLSRFRPAVVVHALRISDDPDFSGMLARPAAAFPGRAASFCLRPMWWRWLRPTARSGSSWPGRVKTCRPYCRHHSPSLA